MSSSIKTAKPFYIYVCSCPTWQNNTAVKIGVSKNPEKRLRKLHSSHDHCLKLNNVWKADRSLAFNIEAAVCRKFTDKRKGREFFYAEHEDVSRFVDEELAAHGAKS